MELRESLYIYFQTGFSHKIWQECLISEETALSNIFTKQFLLFL